MGLNLDLGHVALAADTKFDGRHMRKLLPAEMAQIAGRAGRHVKEGTFGVTDGCRVLEPEVIEAIESGDNSRICDELGDLLFQVIFHSEIKKEENAFSINDVIMSINNKMIRRNPHVFDNKDNKKFTIDEIDKNWKKIKKEEKL